MLAEYGELEFDALVNCAAQTNVDRCEQEPAEAFHLNSQAVATIADVEQRVVEADDFIARRAPLAQQRRAEPPATADDDDLH